MEKLRPAAGQEQRTGSVMDFAVSAVHFPVFIPAALPAVRRLLSGGRHSAFPARERSFPGGACGGAGEERDYLKTQLISGGNF